MNEPKYMRVFRGKNYDDLVNYLLDHEEDIALGINDYGDLRGAFIDIFDRPPEPQHGEIK